MPMYVSFSLARILRFMRVVALGFRMIWLITFNKSKIVKTYRNYQFSFLAQPNSNMKIVIRLFSLIRPDS